VYHHPPAHEVEGLPARVALHHHSNLTILYFIVLLFSKFRIYKNPDNWK